MSNANSVMTDGNSGSKNEKKIMANDDGGLGEEATRIPPTILETVRQIFFGSKRTIRRLKLASNKIRSCRNNIGRCRRKLEDLQHG